MHTWYVWEWLRKWNAIKFITFWFFVHVQPRWTDVHNNAPKMKRPNIALSKCRSTPPRRIYHANIGDYLWFLSYFQIKNILTDIWHIGTICRNILQVLITLLAWRKWIINILIFCWLRYSNLVAWSIIIPKFGQNHSYAIIRCIWRKVLLSLRICHIEKSTKPLGYRTHQCWCVNIFLA